MGSTSIHTFRYRQLAAQLRTWREESGMSQRALAVKLGKPASYVHKCEVAERKLDPLEFLGWIEACKIKPSIGLATIDMFRRKSSI